MEPWRIGRLALACNNHGSQLVPIWPDAQYAELCASDEWSHFAPCSIELRVWLERWEKGMQRGGRLVAAFPIPNGRGVEVDAGRFGYVLRQALSAYE